MLGSLGWGAELVMEGRGLVPTGSGQAPGSLPHVPWGPTESVAVRQHTL